MKLEIQKERRPILFKTEINENNKKVIKGPQRGYFHGFFEEKRQVGEIGLTRPVATVESLTGRIITIPVENVVFVDQTNHYLHLMERSQDDSHSKIKPPTPEKAFDIECANG